MLILTNHLGYRPGRTNRAVVLQRLSDALTLGPFQTIDAKTEKPVFSGTCHKEGKVDNWRDWVFTTLDFSEVENEGSFYVSVPGDNGGPVTRSRVFSIKEDLFRDTISDILYYFRSQRCAGEFDRFDRAVPVFEENRTVDAHGGWYDASGDVSKYLSHLSYTNFMNPQQTPFVVWSMLKCVELVGERSDPATETLVERLGEEALFGADFLVRMQDPSGAFYMTLFDKWSADPKQRMICEYRGQDGERSSTWQSAYRQGGGIAIAALARASRVGSSSEHDSARYLETAIFGFEHLEKHNQRYCNDGCENVIDDYCALLAAVELFKSTKESGFIEAARIRAENLMERISEDETASGWLRADNNGGARPFFHAAEAGLPVVSLLELAGVPSIDSGLASKLRQAVSKMMEFELAVTSEVTNPFGYPRQYVVSLDGNRRTSFFYPHNNESGYWWQGENARLASLAAAAHLSSHFLGNETRTKFQSYAAGCMDWILGRNPFDVCMLHGRGYNNADYEDGHPNVPGGICNGVTSGFTDETDIDFKPETPEAQNGDHSWRWGEQWIPHAAWYLLAVCSDY